MRYFHEKHFSVHEAKAVRARLRPHIEPMVAPARQRETSGFNMHRRQYRLGWRPDTLGPYPPEFHELAEIIRRLRRAGVLVKGVGEGLVDFPHFRADGEEGYLCWGRGDLELASWHPLDPGFAGRQRLEKTDE